MDVSYQNKIIRKIPHKLVRCVGDERTQEDGYYGNQQKDDSTRVKGHSRWEVTIEI